MSEYQTCDLLIDAIDKGPSGLLTKEGVELVRKGWEHGQAAMQSEITALRQQLADAKEENEQVRQANIHTMDVVEDMKAAKEKAEARVAELTHSRQIEKTSMLMRVSRLSETLEAIRSGEFSLPKCQQLADRALGSPVSEAAILRLQAEAVEQYANALATWLNDLPGNPCASFVEGIRSAAEQADRQAKRLRQQADEAERAGGEQ